MLDATRQFVWAGAKGTPRPVAVDVEARALDAAQVYSFAGTNIFRREKYHHPRYLSDHLSGVAWRGRAMDADSRSHSKLTCLDASTGMSGVKDLFPDGQPCPD